METQKLNLGELRTETEIGSMSLSLMDRLVLYEALKIYSDLLEAGSHKSKIGSCPDRIDKILVWLDSIPMEHFIQVGRINIEDLLNWAAVNFEGQITLTVNDKIDDSMAF